jgi:ketosteroid isomerase-like protein
MRLLRLFSLPLALCLLVLPLPAQKAPSREDAAIIAVLQKSAADWNRGDLDSFATSYKNSPDILFIGRTVRRGYAQMLEAYRTGYSTREKMGTLTFSNLEVQPLDEHFATATGHFHLERSAAVGNANGYFMVVMEKTPAGWKIVRDDSTSTDAAPSK